MKKPVQYGLTMENQSLIFEMANAKKDGIYRFRGVVYRVRKGQVTHVAHGGEIFVPYPHFNVFVGKVGSHYQDAAAKALKAIGDEK